MSVQQNLSYISTINQNTRQWCRLLRWDQYQNQLQVVNTSTRGITNGKIIQQALTMYSDYYGPKFKSKVLKRQLPITCLFLNIIALLLNACNPTNQKFPHYTSRECFRLRVKLITDHFFHLIAFNLDAVLLILIPRLPVPGNSSIWTLIRTRYT
jgi:hypothetical protein